MLGEEGLDALARAGHDPLLDAADATGGVLRQVLALDAKLREARAAEPQGEAHPDAVGSHERSLDDLGDAGVEAPVDVVHAATQSCDGGRAPAVVHPEPSLGVHDVSRGFVEERLEARPRVREERELEGPRVAKEELEIARRRHRLPPRRRRPPGAVEPTRARIAQEAILEKIHIRSNSWYHF